MNNSGKTIYSGWAFRLILVNVILYAVQVFAEYNRMSILVEGKAQSNITYYLGLTPDLVVSKGYIWQIFSYMFLHDTYSLAHLFFNMYALLIFGMPIEQELGSRQFLYYYLYCGTFAGLTIFTINFFDQGLAYYVPTIGASGAVFGLLLAFGILFPNAELLLFFIVPIKAKYLVILYGGLELFLELSGKTSTVSHIGHLGGLAAGLIYFFIIKRRTIEFKHKLKKATRNISKKKISSRKITRTLKTDQRTDNNKFNNEISILKKIKKTGIESLTDDEYQYIKYIDIMTQDYNKNVLCNEIDYNTDDEHCTNCENFKACFIREVKKYLSN